MIRLWVMLCITAIVLMPLVLGLQGNQEAIIVLEERPSSLTVSSALSARGDSLSISANTDQLYERVMEGKKLQLPVVGATITLDEWQTLEQDPRIKAVYPNRPVKAMLSTTKNVMNATPVWRLRYNNQNLTGTGQTVCVVDTGVDYTHPAFGSCSSTSNINDGSCPKVIGGYDFVNSDENPLDDNGHGTHVAGIVASENDTYRGMAPGANIIAIKSLNAAGSGSTLNVINGINWCTSNASIFNISVIVLSLGTESEFPSYCDADDPATAIAINAAIAANISVVAAAGNNGNVTGMGSPACIKNATAVGSVTKSDAVSSFSNRNNITDLFGVGSSVTSLRASGTSLAGCSVFDTYLLTCSGTSMSTPAVGGVMALLRTFFQQEYGYEPSPRDIQHILNSTGTPIDDTGGSGFMFQRADVYTAVLSLDNTTASISLVSAGNNSIFSNTSFIVNMSSSETLTFATLEINNTNTSMSGGGDSWSANASFLRNGSYIARVYGTDVLARTNFSTQTRVLIDTIQPVISSVSINSTSVFTNDSVNISVGIEDLTELSSLGLSFNATLQNQTTNVTGKKRNVSFIVTANASKGASINYSVQVTDSAGFSQISASFTLTVENSPSIVTPFLSSTDVLNRTNGSLIGSWNVQDIDQDVQTDNETRWYNGTTEKIELRNLTTISSTNHSKNETWTFSVRTFDGTNWSTFANQSLRISNAAPSTNDSTVSGTELILLNYTITVSDLDNDVVTLTTNSSLLTVDTHNLLWTPNLSDAGNHFINVTLSDGEANASQLITIEIVDSRDADNDGNPDFNDTDDDNDNIDDINDFIMGNASSINSSTSLNISIHINGTSNVSQLFNGSVLVNFSTTLGGARESLVLFNLSVNQTQTLDLLNITLNYSINGSSSFSIRGLSHKEQLTKQVTLQKVNTTVDAVCILDRDADTIAITSGCTASNEILLSCNNVTSSGYTCFDEANHYRITGLNNSAVKELCRDADGDGYGVGCSAGTDCDDNDNSQTTTCSSSSSSSSGGGGGGGGGSSGGGGGGALTSTAKDKVSRFFTELTAGSTYQLTSTSPSFALRKISFVSVSTKRSISLTAQIPDIVPSGLSENIYQVIEVLHPELDEQDVDQVTIRFAVNTSWLATHENIALYRYTDKWTSLTVTEQSVVQFAREYEAASPGLSLFAIVATPISKLSESKLVLPDNESILAQEDKPEANNESDEQPTEISVSTTSWRKELFVFVAILLIVICAIVMYQKKKRLSLNDYYKKHVHHRFSHYHKHKTHNHKKHH